MLGTVGDPQGERCSPWILAIGTLFLRISLFADVAAGDPVQICVQEQLPLPTWPGDSAEASQRAWPFGLQPGGLQCLPQAPTGELGRCDDELMVWVLKEFVDVVITPLSLSPDNNASTSEAACKEHAYASPSVELWQWRPKSGCYTNEQAGEAFPYPLQSSHLVEASSVNEQGAVGQFIQHYCPYSATAVPVIPAHQFRYVSSTQVALPNGQLIDSSSGNASLIAKLLVWEKPLGSRVQNAEALASLSLGLQVVTVFCPVDGWLVRLEVEEGNTVSLGKVIAVIDTISDSVGGSEAPGEVCPELDEDLEHVTVVASESVSFTRFVVAPEDCVDKDETIAMATRVSVNGVEDGNISAPEAGCISVLSNLTEGSELPAGCNVATLRVTLPEGVEGVGLDITEPVMFLDFLVSEGDYVEENGTMAIYSFFNTSNGSNEATQRRLRSLDLESGGGALKAPYYAHIEDERSFHRGDTIRPGQHVMYIKRAKKGDFWLLWIILLLLLLLFFCCLALLCLQRSQDEDKPVEEAEPLVEAEAPPPEQSEPPTPVQSRQEVPPPPPPLPLGPFPVAPTPAPPVERRPPNLKIIFEDDDGQTHEKRFEYHPLGIEFSRRAPIKVSGFKDHSYARQQGVQIGWTIVQIGNHDVHRDHSFEHVDGLLIDGLRDLPVFPVDLVFELPDGTLTEPYRATRHVLGIQWVRHAPIKIDIVKPNSQAEALGIEAGWRIARIGEYDVSHDHSVQHVEKLLYEALQHLPP
mmetsp:Transcript_18901/g.43932  ORF Transcript_18901/g.43932 Transcript_18901/m.43932 type:complete len:751 (+) Transcript_18901:83-2335(+)